MKLRTIALIGALTLPVMAQTKEPDVATLKRELAIQKIKTAIAEANAAAGQVATVTEQATEEAKKKRDVALALIESTKKELGFDDRYEWNFQVGNYVMKPQVGAPKK